MIKNSSYARADKPGGIIGVCKCILLYYARKSLTTKWPKFTGSGKAFPRVIQKYTNLQILQAYIFRILQYFANQAWQFY